MPIKNVKSMPKKVGQRKEIMTLELSRRECERLCWWGEQIIKIFPKKENADLYLSICSQTKIGLSKRAKEKRAKEMEQERGLIIISKNSQNK